MRKVLMICPAMSVLLITGTGVRADEPQELRGRVLDETGRPVAVADVSYFWRANGSMSDGEGKRFDYTKPDYARLVWGNLGKMEPLSGATKTGADGRFSMKDPEPKFVAMAMDQSRCHGGIAFIPKGERAEHIEIRLVPLVTVRGSFEGPGAGQRPSWTHVYVHLPEDPTRPLSDTRIVSCGSFEAKFEFRLPPGNYLLRAYSQFAENDGFEGELVPSKALTLTNETNEVDLGTLRFEPDRPQITKLRAKAKAESTWNDYTQHYGESPPNWHATDARGVSKDVQIAEFQGKFVLIYFWGLDCVPCIAHGLPELMKFYEDHEAQLKQFEIISICIDVEGRLKSMAELDRTLGPIVKHVWDGKTPPFPILLDSTFKTFERFGLPGFGTTILIDPEGKLIKGDLAVLAEKLKNRATSPK